MVKLVECKTCRGMVAEHAKKCPACGTDYPAGRPFNFFKELKLTPALIMVILIPIAFFTVIGLSKLISDTPEEKAQKAVERKAKQYANRKAGFHCTRHSGGTHGELVYQVKEKLKDPGSFEHIRTTITPMDDTGNHRLVMRFRAANSFGGKVEHTTIATVKNSNCEATITSFK